MRDCILPRRKAVDAYGLEAVLNSPCPTFDESGFVGRPVQNARLQSLLDMTGEGVCDVDRAGNYTFVNRGATEMLGYTQEEMLGRSPHVLVHHHRGDGSERPSTECPVHRVLNGDRPLRQFEDTMFRKDGSGFPAEISVEPVAVDGAVVAAQVTFRDVSERRGQRQALRLAEERAERRGAELDALIESVPHGIFIAAMDGSLRLNSRAREMTGAGFPKELFTLERALRGESSTETVCAPESIPEAESRPPDDSFSERPGKSPTKRWIQSVAAPVVSNGRVLGGIAVNTDVTQARLQESVLRKAEKLAAAGQLASSIAHEINNPLEAITNLLYLARHSTALDEVQEYAKQAQTELARVTEITLQTLKFHRQQSLPARTGLAELIETILLLYTGRFLVRGIAVEKRLRTTRPVFCYDGEIRQVLNNLARNAIDAMGEGGTLKVRLCPSHNRRGVAGVRITIADSGEGISPEIAGHLFEPFRTTKELTGTGLGLWVTKGIVDKHGGNILVRTRRSAPTGTVFSLWLPEDGAPSMSASMYGTEGVSVDAKDERS